jgi:hypothetical protein
MLVVAKDLQTQYEKALDSASISRELRPHFRKWLRFYLATGNFTVTGNAPATSVWVFAWEVIKKGSFPYDLPTIS